MIRVALRTEVLLVDMDIKQFTKLWAWHLRHHRLITLELEDGRLALNPTAVQYVENQDARRVFAQTPETRGAIN